LCPQLPDAPYGTIGRSTASTEAEGLSRGFEGLEFISLPPVAFRAIDHQSTLGLYVGKTALRDGHGVMTSYEYLDGAAFQPSDEEVRKKGPMDSK